MKNGTGSGVPAIVPEENPRLPIVRPGMTLWEIMDVLDRMEKGLIDLTGDELGAMSAITRQKVDGYKQFIDVAGGVSGTISQWEGELAQARKSIENKIASLKEHMRALMTDHGFEKLPGHVYEARIQKNPPRLAMNPAFSKPDSDMYRKFPAYIKRTYAWDTDAVKKAIQAGATEFTEFATVEQGTSIRFGVNKAVE